MRNISIGDIITFKLTSGEEVITKVMGEDDHYLQVSDPLSVAPNPQGMGLMPSMFTANHEDVMMSKNTITMWAPTEDNIKDKYISATTGIQLPSKKLVLG